MAVIYPLSKHDQNILNKAFVKYWSTRDIDALVNTLLREFCSNPNYEMNNYDVQIPLPIFMNLMSCLKGARRTNKKLITLLTKMKRFYGETVGKELDDY